MRTPFYSSLVRSKLVRTTQTRLISLRSFGEVSLTYGNSVYYKRSNYKIFSEVCIKVFSFITSWSSHTKFILLTLIHSPFVFRCRIQNDFSSTNGPWDFGSYLFLFLNIIFTNLDRLKKKQKIPSSFVSKI